MRGCGCEVERKKEETEMKIINQKSDIPKIGNPKEIHCTFFLSFRDAFGILSHAPQLQILKLPESFKKVISPNTRKLLAANNVDVVFGNRTGTRTDLEAEMWDRIDEKLELRETWKKNKLPLRGLEL